jgi:hypothetical protein
MKRSSWIMDFLFIYNVISVNAIYPYVIIIYIHIQYTLHILFRTFSHLIFSMMSAIDVLTAETPVLNGYAPLPSSVIGFIHS